MEEAAERRKRLKALRDEVQEPQQKHEGSHKLANPLIDPPDMHCPSPGFSFYSDPVAAFKTGRASTSAAPKQAHACRPSSRFPAPHAGEGQPFSQHHASSAPRPFEGSGHQPFAAPGYGAPVPGMQDSMQWQQGGLAPRPPYSMGALMHGGPRPPRPLAARQHGPWPPPGPPPGLWGHPPHAPDSAPARSAVMGRGGRSNAPEQGRRDGPRGSGSAGRGSGRQPPGRGRRGEGTFDVEAYYQSSMMEDPWKQLRLRQPADAAGPASKVAGGVAQGSESRSHADGALDRPWH